MLVFGAADFITGIQTLVRPESYLSWFSLPIGVGVEPSAHANGLAAVAIGLYYGLSAIQENRALFVFSVPMRLFSAATFWFNGGPWFVVGLWEAAGALTTGVGLLLDGAWSPRKVDMRTN